MRIISGTHKGRKINPPKGLPVRPTTDFAKEGLFNILRNRINFSETTALDLFSGTGNISLELASRGVPKITSIDADVGCVKFIQKTAAEFDFPIQATKADVFKYLDFPTSCYSLIFADPPYDFTIEKMEALVVAIFEKGWLEEEGMLIMEHAKTTSLTTLSHFQEERKYGGCVFSFFF
ncbi:MAG: RsmD family RNA methyltransferase [Flavobacteriaceae bacterium]